MRAIYCPRCRWRPGPRSRWVCTCGHVWNTFDTEGACPGCRKVWLHTQCLACQEWSLHEDWYHDDGPGAGIRETEAVGAHGDGK